MRLAGYVAETAGANGATILILTGGQTFSIPPAIASSLNAARKASDLPPIPTVDAAQAAILEQPAGG